MAGGYRIIGAEMSPYSVKVRSYFRYKAIPYQWVLRNAASQAEFEKHAKMPIIPLVVAPDGSGIQDSTPIIDQIEKLHPEPSIHPDDPVAGFISALIEEFGDEWGNKWMFHYRWARDVDQISSAGRIARMRGPKAGEPEHRPLPARCAPAWWIGSGSSAPTRLPRRRSRPASSTCWDCWTPIWRRGPICSADVRRLAISDCGDKSTKCGPTRPRARLIGGSAPHVLDWVHRMLWPKAEGGFEAWATLEPTLMPILKRHVGKQFMPWTCANEKALAEKQEEFSVALGDKVWTQKPQKYHARSLGVLRARYAAVTDKAALDPVLEAAGCLAGLRG